MTVRIVTTSTALNVNRNYVCMHKPINQSVSQSIFVHMQFKSHYFENTHRQ